MCRCGLLLSILVLPALAAAAEAPRRFEFGQIEMAVDFRIVLYAADEATAAAAAKAAFARLHELNGVMSDYDEQSELRRLCDTAGQGKAVRVGDDLWRVLVRAQEIAAKSDGAFDVTCGQIVRLWRRARRQKELPPAGRLHDAMAVTGYRLVKLDATQQTVELLKPGMRLDLGGIAKGYATAEALKVLRDKGLRSALVEGGGDMALGDAPPERPGWRIGVAPPDQQAPPRFYVWLSNVSVSTSGDMWQFVEIGGRRYSHVVDPRTGVGLTDHNNVTVICADGATADALSKAVAVLGPEKGLPLIEAVPGAAALVVRAPDGRIEIRESQGWRKLRVEPGPTAAPAARQSDTRPSGS